MQELQEPKPGYKRVKFLFGKNEDIPLDWAVVKLIDSCKSKPQYGAALAAIPINSSLPRYIRITDLHDDGSLRIEDKVSINENDAQPYLLSEGEILFARTGATVGKTYAYKKEDGVCAFAGYLIRFVPDEQRLDVKFLLYYTHSYNYWRWLKSIYTEGVQPNVNAEQYSRMLIIKPPMIEQQKIASILSKINQLIQKTDQIIEQTQRLKKGLMQTLLIKGIGHTKFKKVKSFFGKYEQLPEGWRVVKLGEVAKIRYGLSQPPQEDKNGIPMIRATNIKKGKILDNGILRINASSIPKSSDLHLQPGEVIVVRSGAYTGDIGYVTDKFEGAIVGYDLVISPSEHISTIFLANYLLGSKVQDYFSQLKSRVAQSHLNAQQVSDTVVYLPSLSEQKHIDSIILNIDSKISLETNQRNEFNSLKRGLMQKLLTGKIRVKV
jgi:type I restriction enzyme S subunit